MKQKHRDAMIAMGIKIAALERLYKLHGEAHMAQDILPQFRELCKTIEGLKQNDPFWDANKRIPVIISRIEALEQVNVVARECSNRQASEILKMQEQIKTLVRETETLKIQMGNTILHTNKLMVEFTKQQRINDGVQRDLRIITSPGYAKEQEALKQEDYHAHLRKQPPTPRRKAK